MKTKHPCRSLVLKEADEELLRLIKKNPEYSLDLLAKQTGRAKSGLKKRLEQFKRHRLIKASSHFQRITILS